MEVKDYQQEKEKIVREFEEKIATLNRAFVIENKKFKVGNIIKDSSIAIQITKIYYSLLGSEIPLIRYKGRVLKKDLTPTKKEMFETIFEQYAEEINL